MTDGIGAFIRSRRRELGMAQKELAELAEIPQPAISDIERGRIKLPNADLRRRIARVLDVSHLQMLIASGEITEAELRAGEKPPAELPQYGDPPDFLRSLFERVEWTEPRVSMIADVFRGMIALDSDAERTIVAAK